MYKVVIKYKENQQKYECSCRLFSTVYDMAHAIKDLAGDRVVVSIVSEIEERNEFTKHILNRFTRRD